MIRSMTGFAREEFQAEWGRLTIELRSVNHRYLDISFRLPEDFRGLENDFRKQASETLGRGKVEVQLRYQLLSSASGSFSVDAHRVAQLKAALDDVQASFGEVAAPDPMRVMAWPGIVSQDPPDMAPMYAAAEQVFQRALDQLQTNREAEGARLGEFLAERCAGLSAAVKRVRSRYPEVRDGWLQKLRERCQELGADIEPGRLEQEAVMAAQRLDVEEELARLSGHLDEVATVMQRQDPVGRRLDFLMQEFNREANTLGSKSQDGEMTREAVEMKVLIEQMREQVQNIE